MILANELHAEIVRKGLSQRKVAHMLGIAEKTFYAKMKKAFSTVMKMNKAKGMVLGWQPIRIVEPKKKRCG